MATQPFDKETIDKVTEAFKNLNTETKKTLSDFDASAAAEKKMLDIAKQLGQEFKTQKDSLDDQLKGRNLQEQLQLKLKNSESELSTLSQSRINSQIKINDLQAELKNLVDEFKDEVEKGPNRDSEKLKNLRKIIKSKDGESALEENLLKTSSDRLDVLKKQVSTQKILNNTLEKTKELFALIAGPQFYKDLNVPKGAQESFERTYTLFKQIDKSATDLRMQFGLFRKDAEIIEKNIREIVIDLGEFGVKAEDVQKSMSAIGKTFNYIDVLDKSIVKDIVIMSKQMGISAESSAMFLKVIGGIKGESGIANKNMLSLAGAAANAYGVGLDVVMSDVANASDEARMFSGRNADEMVRAAAQARQMGTTLNNMASSAKGLLNFESSIGLELKASALFGKNINFNKARSLLLDGKIVEANKAILDEAKKVNFAGLKNPLLQEAFAQAAGKTVTELNDMFEAESRITGALKSNNKEVKEAAKAQLEKQNLLKTNGELAQDEYEKNLLNKVNQERMVVLQNRLNAALQKIMLPVLESMTSSIENLANFTEGMNLTTLIKNLYSINTLVKNVLGSNITTIIEKVKFVLNLPAKIVKNAINFVKGYLIYFELFAKEKFLSIGKYFKDLSGKSLSKLGDVGWIKKLTTAVSEFGKSLSKLGDAGWIKKLTTAVSEFGKSLSKLGDAGWIKNLITKVSELGKSLSKIGDVGWIKKLTTTMKGLNFSSIIKSIKTLLGSGFGKIFDKISKFGILNKILNFMPILQHLKLLKGFVGKIPIIGNAITAIEFLYVAFKNVMEVLNNPNLTGSEKFLGFFKAIWAAAWTTLVEPWLKIGEWIGENVLGSIYDVILDIIEAGYNIGVSIWDGIKSVYNSVWNGIKNMFSSAWDSIKDWLGFSPSVLGLSIVKGIVSVGDDLVSAITSPFTKAFELIKSGLELIREKMKGIGSFISETIGKTFNFVGRIVGVSEKAIIKPTIETKPVGKSVGVSEETTSKQAGKSNDLLISTIVNSNKALLEKLDKLTSMMASGQIAVYIDGQRANQLLATSNSKFGSFGQATTN